MTGCLLLLVSILLHFLFLFMCPGTDMRIRRSGLATCHEPKTTGRPVRFRIQLVVYMARCPFSLHARACHGAWDAPFCHVYSRFSMGEE